jgi:RimJ/RimL family protein N-acetyltransferase
MQRALQRWGYRNIATKQRYIYRGGCWHDIYLFELLREEWQTQT